jgi:cytochrome c oxidase cbb3-type subunit 3
MLISRVLPLVLLCGAVVLAAEQPNYTPSDIESGKLLYQANCTGCHGPEGDGVSGVNFGSGRFRRGTSDDQLVRIVLGGIAGTAMPPSSFSEGQAGTIVAYLRSLSASDRRNPSSTGDATRGKALYEGKGRCATCHSVSGNGSRVGPNLTDIGATRRATELERSLLEPDAEVKTDNRSVRAVTRDGTTVSGRLLNQDTFTLQVLDANERLLLLQKANLRDYAVLKSSPMPSYKDTFSPQELSDVIAFLVTLKGRS